MYKKTTSSYFNEFGSISNRDVFQDGYIFNCDTKPINKMFIIDEPLIFSIKSGIAIIACCNNVDEKPKQFVIHAEVKLNPGVFFNFISISEQAQITTSKNLNQLKPNITINELVEYQKITPTFQVKEIYSYYHQTKPPLYVFTGETHQYWELTYVDSGSLETTIDNITHRLDAFDLVISAPGQFHSQHVTSKKACTYLTIIFELDIKSHPVLANRIFKYNYQIRDILNEFIRQTNSDTFDISLRDVLIGHLTTLLAKLSISHLESPIKRANKSPQHRNFENKMLANITKFMEQNIYSTLMIDDICRQFGISRTTLQNLFQSELNISPKLYINNLRLDMSKILLRESKYTVSEISSSLGFSSIQYFSKKFKHRFKISPREYAKSTYN